MDRRAFVGSALGSLALAPRAAVAAADGHRPSLAVTPDGADRWRVRSWGWREGAWRPEIAKLVRSGGSFRLEGRVAAADHAALVEWIAMQRA